MSDQPRTATLRTLWRMFNLRRGLNDPAAIDESIRDGVETFGTSLWVLVLAMLIASVGLDVNATAVIIGAMLISPLMGPIVGIGYGLAMRDVALLRKAALTLLIFTAISLASSTLYFSLSPLDEPGSELLARTRPTLWDVLIAFFGGSAGIIALTRRSFSNVLPGVAIATALMPPLCTAGYSIANGQWAWAGGALYLYAINGVFIAFAALVFVKLMRLPRRADLPPAPIGRVRLFAAVTLAAMTVPSAFLAFEAVRTQQYTREMYAAIDASARLADVVVLKREIRRNSRHVELTIAGSARPLDLEAPLTAAIGASPILEGTTVSVRSVTAPQIDLDTIRNALRADVDRVAAQQDQALRAQLLSLQQQLATAAQRESDVKRVADELRAQYPMLTSVEVGLSPGEAGGRPKLLMQIPAHPVLTRRERERLERWLAVRLPDVEVSVAYRTRPTRT